MQPIPLEYHVPQAKKFNWHPIQCIFIFGPLIGCLVGISEVFAVAICWKLQGKFESNFGHAGTFDDACLALAIGGGIVGGGFGIVLSAFELLAARRIRMLIVIPAVVTLAFLVTGVVAAIMNKPPEPGLFVLLELIAIGLALIISLLLSRRRILDDM